MFDLNALIPATAIVNGGGDVPNPVRRIVESAAELITDAAVADLLADAGDGGTLTVRVTVHTTTSQGDGQAAAGIVASPLPATGQAAGDDAGAAGGKGRKPRSDKGKPRGPRGPYGPRKPKTDPAPEPPAAPAGEIGGDGEPHPSIVHDIPDDGDGLTGITAFDAMLQASE